MFKIESKRITEKIGDFQRSHRESLPMIAPMNSGKTQERISPLSSNTVHLLGHL
ncbi:MAG: hypothetical protein M1454_05160 [Candidatus Thermoplasmatota archaeon]|nr:hypothetical protein [Candidatus Thermoplasmatota archaeon]MCL5731010.1 hypothetical protein [Candidatus Thermoplasmatota archaeon]